MTGPTVVLDANVYVSALAFGGRPKRAFQLAFEGRVHVAISEPIRTEVLRTLRDKFHWSDYQLAGVAGLIQTGARLVVPTSSLRVVERDPDDDRVLECAVAAKAELIVTGDLDLLDLSEYNGIRIVHVADFLDLMGDSAQF